MLFYIYHNARSNIFSDIDGLVFTISSNQSLLPKLGRRQTNVTLCRDGRELSFNFVY